MVQPPEGPYRRCGDPHGSELNPKFVYLGDEDPKRHADAVQPGTRDMMDPRGSAIHASGTRCTTVRRIWSKVERGHPFMLFGQMSTADPSRSPIGTESAWRTRISRGA
jgi:hypothetical protein